MMELAWVHPDLSVIGDIASGILWAAVAAVVIGAMLAIRVWRSR